MRWKNYYQVVNCHAEGEVGKVLTGGVVDVPGETMFDKREYLRLHRDDIRRLCLSEPRGSVIDSLNIVLPSAHPETHVGFVTAGATDYPVMSGSNLMCVATVLLETGMVPMQEPETRFVLEAPAGAVQVTCQCSGGKVTRVRFVNQPAFVFYEQHEIHVSGFGALPVDIAYGGETFVQIDAEMLGLRLEADEAKELSELGELIKRAASQQLQAIHPMNTALTGITQAQFMGPLTRTDRGIRSRNAVIVSPGRLDRSPGGTATSARLALLHRRKQITPGEILIHESIIGTCFEGSIERQTQEGPYPAVVTSVAGQAWITGMHQICLDTTDPLASGYTLSDTWPQMV
ncbi:proline racemase family protein [Burkholderia cenocepacia]|uniref:proline racemase family protein n=1 Tax=Burkholderia pseudomultivorans TaxID=1207504 RepID=UPI00075761D1|nr:proline racemase family protein [Burkholderia pseudomultivorans]KVG65128.1 hypothetical protein WS80_17075 [Burkholderia pseudomultivorans]